MLLEELRLIHMPKGATSQAHAFEAPARGFFLDSCQRKIWFGSTAECGIRSGITIPAGAHVLSGSDAYLFLLRVSVGLESRVLGETDIFGQIKESWKAVREENPELQPWFCKLFEDAKEIRSRHLQNLGGASYGTLVRKLMRAETRAGGAEGPVLLLGAGQIIRSVTPYLSDVELWAWNRSLEKVLELGANVRAIGDAQLEQAWMSAAHVVIGVPAGASVEPKWIELARKRSSGAVIHLGGMSSDTQAWQGVHSFHSLESIFELQSAQDGIRSAQIERAARACEERAKLRALGTSVTLPHGWEDLALFA